MKFVKAIERNPTADLYKKYHIKISGPMWGKVVLGVGQYIGRWVDFNFGSISDDELEWLDESVEVVTKEHFDNMEYALTEGAELWESKYYDEVKTSESLRKALTTNLKKGKSPYNY